MGGRGQGRPRGAERLTAAVTEAESEVLAALWRRGPLSPADLIAEVQASRSWGAATVKTLLGRLLRKGAIRSERGERHLYHPVLTRDAYRRAEVHALAERAFGGRLDELRSFLDRELSG